MYEDTLEGRAWKLYCDGTKSALGVKDSWLDLSPKVQQRYKDLVLIKDYIVQ